jgi:LPXTG-site transpeptidase (sortase) family protein
MIASQFSPMGTVNVIEAKISKNLSGETVRSYQELISGNKLGSFPNFGGRFVMGSTINPNDHNMETRKDLITGEEISNGSSDPTPTETETPQDDPTDPRNKPINYNTSCMGYLTIPGTNGVVENRCIRWKDKSKNSRAETNNVSTGIYTLPVSNYPNVKNGNLVLAAHSGTASISYFKTLYLLKLGDIAKVKFNGNTYTYVIKNIYLVPKTGVVKITRNSSKTTLTLITCTKNDEAHQTVYILELRDIDGKEYS